MPIKVLKKDENKIIPVAHSKDHPDVKTTENIIKKDREKAKEDFPILSKMFGTGNPKKDTEKAKRVADTLQTMASKLEQKQRVHLKRVVYHQNKKQLLLKLHHQIKLLVQILLCLKKKKQKAEAWVFKMNLLNQVKFKKHF